MMKNMIIAALAAAGSFAAVAETLAVDNAHSAIGFKVKHMMVGNVSGTFDDYEATVTLEDGQLKAASATLQAGSINTRNSARDKHLRNPDFFDVEKHPTLTFTSTEVTETELKGDLTMLGVTKPVVLSYSMMGPITDPWGKTRYGLQADGLINRKDWGLAYNGVLEGGGVTIGESVELRIDVEVVK